MAAYSLRFRVHYNTEWGQNLYVTGADPQFGGWIVSSARRMQYRVDGFWELEVPLEKPLSCLTYKYVLVDDRNGATFWEGSDNRSLPLDTYYANKEATIEFRDTWMAARLPEVAYLNTTLFQNVIFGREREKCTELSEHPTGGVRIRFRALCSYVQPNQCVYVVGSTPRLGQWDPQKALPLQYTDPNWETEHFELLNNLPFQYKYIIKDKTSGHVVKWEDGSDRMFEISNTMRQRILQKRMYTVIAHDVFRRNRYDWRGFGIAIPLFSIRTQDGLGIGEFLDLKLLVDLCTKIGAKLIQILPINDTSVRQTWRDSYPYSAVSVFALHPIYIRLQQLTKDRNVLAEIEAKRQQLNELPQIDYEEVYRTKMQLLKRIFKSQKKSFLASENFGTFFEEHKWWLVPYALFNYFKEKYETADHSKWPKEYQNPTTEMIQKLTSETTPHFDQIAVYYFIQYHAHEQLLEASRYAAAHRVGLKGDLPIGVNRRSADTWLHPHLFRLHMSTGAPPDAFSETGQNWGFPSYNWDEMKKDNYAWWRARLQLMGTYFHAFRIDHILGFFRIWEIPNDFVSGLMGWFNPSIPLHRNELESAGIWDIRRLTEPYVRWGLLEYYFGDDAQYVAAVFFYIYGWDRFHFKEEYNTERKILAYIKTLPTDNESAIRWRNKLKEGLIHLVQNVCLLKHPEIPDAFIPRVNMFKTNSFQELEDNVKHTLYRLYLSYYYERQDNLWASVAMSRLPIIKSASRMLVCGEDLGMVPKCVEPVMNDLCILGLRIQRMPANPDEQFGWPPHYSYLTVNTTSSHDTSTLRAWWEEDRKKTQDYFNWVLGQWGSAPYFCEPWIVELILKQHLQSPSMWSIIPLQDLFALRNDLRVQDPTSERVNVPANPKHYWRYRIHVTVEQLLENKGFLDHVRTLVQSSERFA
jgi:4-alpha-glucanotransferase